MTPRLPSWDDRLRSVALDILAREPAPPRVLIERRRLLRAMAPAWETIASVLGLAVIGIGILQLFQPGPLALKIIVATVAIGGGLFLLSLFVVGYKRIERVLRTGIVARAQILAIDSLQDIGLGLVDVSGSQRVELSSGAVETELNVASTWGRQLREGSRIVVLWDPETAQVRLNLGPIDSIPRALLLDAQGERPPDHR